MNFGSNQKQPIPISEKSPIYKIVKVFERYEYYALALLALVILLFATGLPGTSMLCLALMNTLAVLYFFSAFMPVPELPNAEKVIFMFKLAGISSAVALVGFLFSMLNWPGSRPMLIGGMLTSLVFLLFSLFTPVSDETLSRRIKIIRIRSLFLAIICGAYIFTPQEILIENGFKKINPTEQHSSNGNDTTQS